MISIDEIIARTGATLVGTVSKISGINTLTEAGPTDLTFLDNKRYQKHLKSTKAAVVILKPEFLEEAPCPCLVTDEPYLAYAKITSLFAKKLKTKTGISSSAIIGESCQIAKTATIEAGVILGDNVHIGEHVLIQSGSVIEDDCVIGDHTIIKTNVTICHEVKIGSRCIIHNGAVLGSDGFGNANDKGIWIKIHQLGSLIVGSDVEIGANTTIDRGALQDTVIGDNVRIDNLVQIGHNVKIGSHTAIAGCTGIAGSAEIGEYCLIGGACAINGHIKVCDFTMLMGTAMVTGNIEKPGVYASGTGLLTQQDWVRAVARFRQLDSLAKRLKTLEDKIG